MKNVGHAKNIMIHTNEKWEKKKLLLLQIEIKMNVMKKEKNDIIYFLKIKRELYL